ncbi:hypothetical protein AD936_06355, partial [Gluconobacter japonicus]
VTTTTRTGQGFCAAATEGSAIIPAHTSPAQRNIFTITPPQPFSLRLQKNQQKRGQVKSFIPPSLQL